jgi:hypothetical protein
MEKGCSDMIKNLEMRQLFWIMLWVIDHHNPPLKRKSREIEHTQRRRRSLEG